MAARKADLHRKTNETDIQLSLQIEGEGKYTVSTGVPFLDHMLELFTRHGFFNLTLQAKGDVAVEFSVPVLREIDHEILFQIVSPGNAGMCWFDPDPTKQWIPRMDRQQDTSRHVSLDQFIPLTFSLNLA